MGIAIYDNIRLFFSHIISRIAVPSFYLFSGYLFFYKVVEFNKTIYLNKLKSRYKTILIPYVVWNVLYIYYNVVSKIGKGIIHPNYDVTNEIISYFSEHGWLNMLWACNVWPFRIDWFGGELSSSGPIMVPLWFLRDLMVAVLLSFVFYKMIKKYGEYFMLLLLFCYMSGLWPSIPGLSVSCFLYFCMGAYISIKKKNMLVVFSKYGNAIVLLALILMILMIVFKSDFTFIGQCIYPVFTFFGVLATFIVTGVFIVNHSNVKIPSVLSRASFFIYVSHTFLILGYCTTLMTIILPNGTPLIMTIRYISVPIICAAVCLLMYILMERYTPFVLQLLTGNRNKRGSYKLKSPS